ncbi:alpha/beta-hydrolase [Cristinia sonorae]|uniref:Alpha/beta-hydrolase n=1 Tax=Cristinia sonorae TaxID=1940300 RepID=A0A8K0UVL1_9AGAR|nr:alpha/beta-hydrolase [Cristinia sonorae]
MPTTGGVDSSALTITYKHVDGHPILADVFLPSTARHDKVPALVYFHGGGLTVGDRRSWFPSWLKDRLISAGVLFVSADYRLMPPATGLEILQDIIDLFGFLENSLDSYLEAYCASTNRSTMRIDPSRIAVAGTSAGGLCAYLAAQYASPKPTAVLGIYALGGDFLTSHFLSVKTHPFYRGRELLDPATYSEFLYPSSASLVPTSESALRYHPTTSAIPGLPANPRMFLARLYLQLGNFLDYYTGMHEPSLSLALRGVLENDKEIESLLRQLLNPEHLRLFPQLHVSQDWPPTLLIHGESDTALPATDSINMRDILAAAGVDVSLEIVPGQEHSFDYAPDAEKLFSKLFDRAGRFLQTHLQSLG